MLLGPTIRRLATSAALVHTLPGASAVLWWPDAQRRVGRHPSHDITVCAWRDAVIQAGLTASLLPVELLTGLPGPPEVELIAGACLADMGGGVYRHDGVDVFATTLCGPAIRDVAASCATSGHARIGVHRDELTATTLVAVAHVGTTPPTATLAQALSVGCSVWEVSSAS